MQLHSICMSGELLCVYFLPCWNASQGACALIDETLVNGTRTKQNTWSAFLFPSRGSLRHSPAVSVWSCGSYSVLHPEISCSSVCSLFAETNQLEIALMMSSCVNYVSKILHCMGIPAPRFSIKHWHDLNVFSCLFRWIIKIWWPTFLLLVNTLKD